MEILIDDASPQFTLSAPNQGSDPNLGWVQGFNKVSASAFNYLFNATGIRVYGSYRDNHGAFAYTLDGSPEVEGDGWSRIRTFDNLKAEYKDLDPAVTHNITFTNYRSRNKRPDDAVAMQSWFDIDYIYLDIDVQGVVRTTRHLDNDNTFRYDGDWQSASPADGAVDMVHRSSMVGSSASLYFTGTSVQLFGSLSPEHGQYAILIDGVEAARQYNAVMFASVTQVPLYTASGLQDGPHVLQIINRGRDGRDAFIDVAYAVVNTTLSQDAPLPAIASSTSAAPTEVPLPSVSSSTRPIATTSTTSSSHTAGGAATELAANSGQDKDTGTPPGAIAGIVVGAVVLLGVIAFAIWYFRRKKPTEPSPLRPWTPTTQVSDGTGTCNAVTPYAGRTPMRETMHYNPDYASSHSHGSSVPPELARIIAANANANNAQAFHAAGAGGGGGYAETSTSSFFPPMRQAPYPGVAVSVVPSSAALGPHSPDGEWPDEPRRNQWGHASSSASDEVMAASSDQPPPAYVNNGAPAVRRGKN